MTMAQIDVAFGKPQPQGPGEDPLLYYTKIFVRFLQLVFATFEQGAYNWSSDSTQTDIQITDQSKQGRETFEKRPAITVARGMLSATNLAYDQFRSFDPVSGRKTKTDLYNGSVVYNCLSSSGLEAQRIAWISSYATRTLKLSLMKAGIHRVGEDISIGPESSPGSIIQGDPGEVTLVQVNVPFLFQQTWTIEPINKLLLKDISANIQSTNSQLPDTGATVVVKDPVTGRPLVYDKLITLNSGLKIPTAPTPKGRK